MIIYVDMDGVLCDFDGAVARDKADSPETPYPQSRPQFYRELAPMSGAINGIKTLSAQDKQDVYILTAPSVYNPLSYTEKRLWVEDHLGFEWTHKLIISPDKSLLKGDVLIDDHKEGRGQEGFEGRLIHFGSDTYPDWSTVLEALL